MMSKAFLTMLAIAATSASANAQAGRHPGPARNWDTIGYQTVGAGVDRDEIRVRGNDRFKQVRVCAVNRPFRLVGLQLRFANGGQQDVGRVGAIRAGACSDVIDLKGNRRNLEVVSLAYRRLPRGMTPLVRVQAR